MQIRLALRLPLGRWQAMETDLFQLEDVAEAEERAVQMDGAIYCWKTAGNDNWLEYGISVTDALGLVILPRGLPESIGLPDDPD